MSTRTTLVSRMGLHVARWLVAGPVPSIILAGVLALAGYSAEAFNAASESHARQFTLFSGAWGPVCEYLNYLPGRIMPLCFTEPTS
jgi:hypothetical protein